MDIVILAVIDGKTEQHEILTFPDPARGLQAFGVIQQIGRNRLQSAIDEYTREAVFLTGDIEAEMAQFVAEIRGKIND